MNISRALIVCAAPMTPVHGRAAFAVWTLHGLAGSSHLVGILPALALPSHVMAGAYCLLFGMGSVAGMGTLGSFVGWSAGWPVATGVRAQAAKDVRDRRWRTAGW
jgi:hypothetical protein